MHVSMPTPDRKGRLGTNIMLTTHARSVFASSCLSTPRDSRPPVEPSAASNAADSPFPKSKPFKANPRGVPKRQEKPQDDGNFGISLEPGSPCIQQSLISPRPSNGIATRGINGSTVNPYAIPGNERQSGDDMQEDYATLFATLLESNTLLREEIQSLKEQQASTQDTLEQLSRRDEDPLLLRGEMGSSLQEAGTPSTESGECFSKSLPQVLENAWVEPKIHTPSDTESVSDAHLHSCQSSEHSLHSFSSFESSSSASSNHSGCGEEIPPEALHSELEDGHAAQEADTASETSISFSCLSTTTNSSYSAEQQANLPQNDPFASPGVLAVEKMWDNFSVDDYTFYVDPDRSTSGEKKPREWTPKITIPKPFAMTIRESTTPKQKSQSVLIAEREEMERRAWEEAELKKQFRATPVPAHTFLPLYELVNARNEQRREQIKLLSKEILKSTEKPFSFSKRDEAKMQAKAASVRQSQKFERARELEEKQFTAKPIPKHVFDPTADEKIQEQEEYRRIRIKMRAEELLASSKLPGSMQTRGKEYTVGSLRKKRLETNEKHAFPTSNHNFHPSVRDDIPNYNQAYEKFSQELAKRKRTKHTTITAPFYLRTELIPSRKEQVLDDLRADEEVMPENRWPFIAARKKVSRKSPVRPKCTSRSVSEGGVMYATAMTATTRARQSLTKERLAGILAEERAEEERRREKKERDRALKATVSQKSMSHDPSAWLEEKQKEKLQQFRYVLQQK